MHYKSSLLIAALLVLSPAAQGAAQESLTLTLEDPTNLGQIIEEALRSNPEILAARRGTETAHARIAQASSLDDPELNFESWAIPLS